jgi:hypothetical protein
VLDRQRLGKQRVEAKQLVQAIEFGGAWHNHPAAKMWRGYLPALCQYGMAVCAQWISRGYEDTTYPWFRRKYETVASALQHNPPWLGDDDFHRSHRSNLMRKDAIWYSQFDWNVPDDLPYIWPAGGLLKSSKRL